jgi:hypothetical protein
LQHRAHYVTKMFWTIVLNGTLRIFALDI